MFRIPQFQYTSFVAGNSTAPSSLYDVLLDPQISVYFNLFFTYVFTALVLLFLHRNFHRFIQSRQAFSLHLIHSISARTVLVTNIPRHLRGDKVLAEYFESCQWSVESVSVCREVEPLKKVLEKRTKALLELEKAWAEWVGNPASGVTGYDPDLYAKKKRAVSSSEQNQPLIPGLDEPSAETPSEANGINGTRDPEHAEDDYCHVHTTRPRPTVRPHWFGNKVDAIEFWEREYRVADEEVRQLRRKGRFEATQNAFVTFDNIRDAVSLQRLVRTPSNA